MTMDRRSFLRSILVAAAAPVIIKADALMPVRSFRSPLLVVWGDGIRDDAPALNAWLAGARVLGPDGKWFSGFTGLHHRLESPLVISGDNRDIDFADSKLEAGGNAVHLTDLRGSRIRNGWFKCKPEYAAIRVLQDGRGVSGSVISDNAFSDSVMIDYPNAGVLA